VCQRRVPPPHIRSHTVRQLPQRRQLTLSDTASGGGTGGAATRPWAEHDCRLVLEDGSVFHGNNFGATGTVVNECVFNTSLSGYQEIMTDPSYAGQFVCFTCPHIGNVGINSGARLPLFISWSRRFAASRLHFLELYRARPPEARRRRGRSSRTRHSSTRHSSSASRDGWPLTLRMVWLV
jgi:hypothetical protein